MKLNANRFVPQLHIPSFGWARQAPLASLAGTSSCTAKNSQYHVNHGRFIYYLFSTANFWRYDTVTDGWMPLSVPNFAITTYSSLVFRGDMGVNGNVLGASANSITLPNITFAKGYESYEIQILQGTGAGQRRVITQQSQPTVHAVGCPTAVTALVITDTTKAWQINQWRGYAVRIINGTGAGQVRRILHNDATSLTITNVARNEVGPDASPAAASPALVVTAGSQSVYQIESTVCLVESDWAVVPDDTSVFEVRSGRIFALSGTASSWALQSYSIAEDLWYGRAGVTGLLSGNPTDGSIEMPDETWSVLWTGKATAGTTTSLTDSEANWVVNEWAGRWMFIWSGPGEGNLVKIVSNTQTVLTWTGAITAPTTLTRYRIWSLEAGTVTQASSGVILTDTAAAFTVDRYAKAYQLRVVWGTGMGQVRRIVSNTATTITLDKAITLGVDSVYQIQPDASTSYMAFAGTPDVLRYGSDHGWPYRGFERDYGNVNPATAQWGDERGVAISSGVVAGAVCTITTINPHGYRTGMLIKHRGDTGASAAANNITASITVTGANTYTYPVPGSVANWTITALTSSIVKDASKSWTPNEHAGRLVSVFGNLQTTGQAGLSFIGRIQSNTADTLTLVSAHALPVAGVSQYVIHDNEAIGGLDSGLATGASQATTTLQDTTKNWVVNQWAGRYVRFLSGSGVAAVASLITSNTSNTLTFGAVTAPVAGSTSYTILAQPVRGSGFEMTLPFNTDVTGDDCRYLYVPRGASFVGWDVFDLTTGSHRLSTPQGQQNEVLGIGSMFVYDGKNRIYFTRDATNRLYYLDLTSGVVYSGPQIPYVVGTAIVGNRLDIVVTKDRLRLLYVNRHSNVEFFKALLWWES